QGGPARAQLEQVIRFSRLARDNLDLSDDVLGSVSMPIRVEAHVLRGRSTGLSSFAVAVAAALSLMFVSLFMTAGTLAVEREENVARRLLRGLVSRTTLLLEKAVLAAGCAALVALLMLAGLALFVDLDWGRFPWWAAAAAAGALAFGAMGVAMASLAGGVRAASLVAFAVSLPIAFLALVPSGAVSPALYGFIRGVSALFPFRPALDAMNAGLSGSSGMVAPLLHLAALAVAFGALARIALQRFG
ncbi:MAG: ABC transporter permease, partial [Actinomycetota bacterium]|nr:ABC transporter permease [Actinomycetota bacterium]